MQRSIESKKMVSTPVQSMFFPSKKPALSLDQMCVVLDIDDTLSTKIKREEHPVERNCYLDFVKEHAPESIIPITIDGTTYDHILSPGVIEAVQYLIKQGCHLAFFSHAIDVRNQQFKTELLKRALSPADFKKYHEKIPVFSREKHFVDGKEELQPSIITRAHGNQKKDLNFVINRFAELGVKLSLDQIIFIDDDLSWMVKGQEKNFLKIPGYYDYDLDDRLSSLSSSERNKLNHIFYAMGLISTILKSDNPLDTLFNLQFKESTDYPPRKEYDYELSEQPEYYTAGLELLRTVNPDLQLLDDEYLKQVSSSKKQKMKL